MSFFTLMFHGVVESLPEYSKYPGTNDCQLRKADFEKAIRYCSDHFKILQLSDLDAYYNGTAKEDGVLITFDDGLYNLCTHALPVLQKYNTPATVFITSDWTDRGVTPPVFALEYVLSGKLPATIQINKNNFSATYKINSPQNIASVMHRIWSDLLMARIAPLLLTDADITLNGRLLNSAGQQLDTDCWRPASWHMLAEAKAGGLLEIGAHGKTHAPWTWLSNAELELELTDNKAKIKEHLGVEVSACSYPHGLQNENTRSIVNEHFTYAFANTASEGMDRMNVARYNVPYQRPNNISLIIKNMRAGNLLRRLGSLSKLY